MTADQIRALFARRQQFHDSHDASALASDHAADCTLESPIAGAVHGRERIEQVYRDIFTAFPDLRFQPKDLLVDGDTVVQIGAQHGTDTGGFLGMPPTGKQFHVPAVLIYTLRNGQISHERRIYDFSGFLLQLAGDRGPAIESTRLYRETLNRARMEQELKIAAEIQRTLQPGPRYTGQGFEIASASVPCRAIGGDFHDYFDLPGQPFSFVLGDVAGKGPPAALVAGLLHGVFAANADRNSSPAETMRQVNALLVRRPVQTRFATIFYATLNDSGLITYCNAGHNPPIVAGSRGIRRLDRGGMIAGAFENAAFEQDTVQLDPGDTLVAFSDGLTEAMDLAGDEFGEERLLSAIGSHRKTPPATLLDQLMLEVDHFRADAEHNDDLTLIVLRYAYDPR